MADKEDIQSWNDHNSKPENKVQFREQLEEDQKETMQGARWISTGTSESNKQDDSSRAHY